MEANFAAFVLILLAASSKGNQSFRLTVNDTEFSSHIGRGSAVNRALDVST
jgi:hypothetical protein